MAILAPNLTSRAAWMTALTAGTLALLLRELPLSTGLLIAVLLALLLGAWIQTFEAASELQDPQ
jgi:3-polyprenyl-4-hydroxybenzoate decarboxylase